MTRLAIALTLVALLLVAGCGDDDPETTTVSTTTASSTTTAPTDGGPTDQTGAGAESEPDTEPANGAGGGAEKPAEQRPTEPEAVIETVFTGSASAELICDELLTAEYLKTAYGSREGCLAAQKPGSLADSIEIENLSRNAATVVPKGGPYDGVDVEVELSESAAGPQVSSLLADVPAGP